jgi:hypothetical protein
MRYSEFAKAEQAFDVEIDRAPGAAAEAVFAKYRESEEAFRCVAPDTASEAARRLEYVWKDVQPQDWRELEPLAPLADEIKACAKALRSRKPQPKLAARLWRLSADADRLAGEDANAAVLIWNTVRGATKPRGISG